MEPALYIHQGSLWRPGQGHVTATEFCQNNRHRSAIKTEEIGGVYAKTDFRRTDGIFRSLIVMLTDGVLDLSDHVLSVADVHIC